MLKLDHFVVHVDGPAGFDNLKRELLPLGIPFEPTWGKGTKGFKVANLWVGDEYFELVWLKRRDGGGWRPEWVARYNEGQRGLTAIMLRTDDLTSLTQALVKQGLTVGEPERVSFRWLFFEKTMPWRTVYLPPIPGTNIQLTFSHYDTPAVIEKFRPHMVPNARDHGLTGLHHVQVEHAFTEEARDFLQRVFPDAAWRNGKLEVALSEGHSLAFTTAARELPIAEIVAVGGASQRVVNIENIRLRTVSIGDSGA